MHFILDQFTNNQLTQGKQFLYEPARDSVRAQLSNQRYLFREKKLFRDDHSLNCTSERRIGSKLSIKFRKSFLENARKP